MPSTDGSDDAFSLPTDFLPVFDRLVDTWEREQNIARLWVGDSDLWTGSGEEQWLGWLRATEGRHTYRDILAAVSPRALEAVCDDVVVLGMGGSSLCPDVLRSSFGTIGGAPVLHVLDSTDPEQVRSLAARLPLDRSLFIVSSKSGTTLESNILMEFFFDAVGRVVGEADVGSRFVAVTDPGSGLEDVAADRRFRAVFHGIPSIGGRFSALSCFGLVPAAAMGLDVETLLGRADAMKNQCREGVPIRKNPGAMLGLFLGALARAGRDKATLVLSPTVRGFGAWAEQLLAESTGKDGRGVIPIDGEDIAAPRRYGSDRLFVDLRDRRDPRSSRDDAIDRIEQADHPLFRIGLTDLYDLGAEFFRWEFATAVAGAVLQVNPFDQPDVEASKVETRRLMSTGEATGRLPEETPRWRDSAAEIELFSDDANLSALGLDTIGERPTVESIVGAHLGRLRPGDYFAVLAYVDMSDRHMATLQRLRTRVRDRTGNATCVGFGPRFLHSTGQAYKGGPNSGVFLQITCNDPRDVEVPKRAYTFGAVKAAQARGDLDVLSKNGRRVIRLHLTGEVSSGLERIAQMVEEELE